MPTSIRNDRPLYEPLGALFDMGASAARGVTRGTLGLPGDLESLARLITGGNQILPTSSSLDKSLPKVTPLVADMKPYDDIGMYYNIPMYGKVLSTAGKGIKKLGGKMVDGESSIGRREFMKGAAALGAAGATAKLTFVDDILKQLPKTEDAAKVASKYKFNSLKEYNDYLNDSLRDSLTQQKALLAKEDEQWYNQMKEFHKNNPNATPAPYSVEINPQTNMHEVIDWNNAFSPQAKAEMREFKKIADDFKWDNAGGKMFDENPHMYNYPDIDTERLIEKYYEKDTTHWSDLLDDYLNSKYE